MMRLTLTLVLFLWTVPLYAFDSAARAIMVIDHETGTVLLNKNADLPIPPASMSKLMTLNMVFEALEDGRITLDTRFRVSKNAVAIRGSTMFLRVGEQVSVHDLLQGIIVQSGNDACVTIAENLTGSETAFVQQMNERARALGMMDSNFANATGWPHPNHKMSPRDLLFLANRLLNEFPQYYPMFSQREFTWDGVTQPNRNPLLGQLYGADGFKTGHTQEAGYGLVGSVKQGNRRVLFVISGLNSAADRAKEAEKIATWALRSFKRQELFNPNDVVAQASVWLGDRDKVNLITKVPISAIAPIGKDKLSLEMVLNTPLPAPIDTTTPQGRLLIKTEGLPTLEYPLYAQNTIAPAGLLKRMKSAMRLLSARYLGFDPFAQ